MLRQAAQEDDDDETSLFSTPRDQLQSSIAPAAGPPPPAPRQTKSDSRESLTNQVSDTRISSHNEHIQQRRLTTSKRLRLHKQTGALTTSTSVAATATEASPELNIRDPILDTDAATGSRTGSGGRSSGGYNAGLPFDSNATTRYTYDLDGEKDEVRNFRVEQPQFPAMKKVNTIRNSF
jgi:hypothetical protein